MLERPNSNVNLVIKTMNELVINPCQDPTVTVFKIIRF